MAVKFSKKWILIGAFFSILCVLALLLPIFIKQLFKTNKDVLYKSYAYTDPSGQVDFLDKSTGQTIKVQVKDKSSNTSILNIRVEIIMNSDRVFILAFDETGLYIPGIYEGPIKDKQQSYLGVSDVKAQGPVGIILILLEAKSKIKAIEDLISLVAADKPEVEKWNWNYRDECWTHQQLKKEFGIAVEGVQTILDFIFPAKSPGGIDNYDQAIEDLLKAVKASASDNIDISDVLKNLPDPVKTRIYFVPITIPTITIQYLGPCDKNQVTPFVEGGFATLMAKEQAHFFVATPVASKKPDTAGTGIIKSPSLEPTTTISNFPLPSRTTGFADGILVFGNTYEGSEWVMQPDGNDLKQIAQSNGTVAPFTTAINRRIAVVLDPYDPEKLGCSITTSLCLLDLQNSSQNTTILDCGGGGCGGIELIRMSPDGKKIVLLAHDFQKTRWPLQLYILNSDGTGLEKLSDIHLYDYPGYIAWSPDSQHILFSNTEKQFGPHNLYEINIDGSGLHKLLTVTPPEPSSSCTVDSPFIPIDWSPSGDRIAYVYQDYSTCQDVLTIITPDGTPIWNNRDISISNTSSLRWSPNGNHLLISAYPGKITSDCNYCGSLYMVDKNGNDFRRITPDLKTDSESRTLGADGIWSPDGTQIAFVSDREYRYSDKYSQPYVDIYIMNADGTNITRVTSDDKVHTLIAWLP